MTTGMQRAASRRPRRVAAGCAWLLAVGLALGSPVSAQDPARGDTRDGTEDDVAHDAEVDGVSGSSTWHRVRPPVLGLRLEAQGAGALHRLVGDDGSVLAQGPLARCQEALATALVTRHGDGEPNVPLPTLGGAQLWADVFWHGGWRIQRNVLTGHHRLLDPDDVRRAWGSHPACRAVFERQRADGKVSAGSPGHLVILLHGLGRTRGAMDGMGEALRREGFSVAALGYPSTRATVDEHAARLGGVMASLEGVDRVSFVTHSLGGIVVRALLAADADWRAQIELGGVVMLAPPNQGSALARTLDSLVFEAVLGPSGQQLADETLAELPAPPCPFGIVAAGRGDDEGFNPLLPGVDDGIVSVEETRLPGAADVLLVRGMHTFVMDDPEVQSATARFLHHGSFAPAVVEDAGAGGR